MGKAMLKLLKSKQSRAADVCVQNKRVC
eukprot:SAG11_NODE_7591_length_1124_cov_1.172683_2_plen_28_part_01